MPPTLYIRLLGDFSLTYGDEPVTCLTTPRLHSLLAYLLVIQVTLIVLNLLPLPGLDGYGVIEPFLPRAVAEPMNAVRPWGLVILLALVLSGGLDFVWDVGFAVGERLGADPFLVELGAGMASLR